MSTRRQSDNDIQATGKHPPKWLGKHARACWRRWVAENGAPVGALRRDLLAAYAEQYGAWRDSVDFVAEHGRTYVQREKNGEVKAVLLFPQVAIGDKARSEMRAIAKLLDPPARKNAAQPKPRKFDRPKGKLVEMQARAKGR